MDKFLELLPYSSKAVVSIFLVALAGVFLIRAKIMTRDSLKLVGQLVLYVFLPCLLFHKIAASVSWARLQEYWVLPLTCVIYIFSGLVLGWITVKLCRPRREIRKGALAAMAFNNSGYIPISLIVAVTAVFPVFSADPQSGSRAVGLIATYLVLYSPLLWTIGYSLVSGRKLSEVKISKLFPPPVIGILAGLAVALIAPLKGFFHSPDGFLHPLYQAAGLLGEATVPCALVLLGGCLASGPGSGLVNKRTIFSVILIKLIAFPALAICYVLLLRHLGVLPANLLISVILVIEAASPPANNLVVMAAVSHPEIEESLSAIIFWTYLCSIFTLTLTIVAAMWVFGG
jgi:hypothetical protein